MTIQEIAKQYRSLGMSVVPAHPPGTKKNDKWAKFPKIKWEEFEKRIMTEEEIDKFFDDPCNIGFITGEISGIDVLDLDSYKEQYYKKYGFMDNFKNISPLTVTTQGGGKHCYFKHTPGLSNSAGRGTGIDFRADGGFIMLPPSYFEEGKEYRWDTEPTQEIIDSLPPLPEWILKEIIKAPVESYTAPKKGYETTMVMPEGGRDFHIYKCALSYLRQFEKRPNGEEEAFLMVQKINETYCDPPLTDSEVKEKFASAKKIFRRTPNHFGKSEVATTNHPGMETQINMAIENYLNPSKGDLSTGFPAFDEIIKGLEYANSYLFFADTNVGKSIFMLNLIINLSKQGINSVYFDLENVSHETLERLAMMYNDLSRSELDEIKKTDKIKPYLKRLSEIRVEIWDLLLLNERVQGEITWESVKNIILKKIEEGVSVFVVDHIHYFHEGGEDYNFLGKVAKEVNDICQVHNVIIFLLAHTKKDSTDSRKKNKTKAEVPVLSDIFGSSMITRHTKNAIAFDRCTDSDSLMERELIACRVRKQKNGANLAFNLKMDEKTLKYSSVDSQYVIAAVRDKSDDDLEVPL